MLFVNQSTRAGITQYFYTPPPCSTCYQFSESFPPSFFQVFEWTQTGCIKSVFLKQHWESPIKNTSSSVTKWKTIPRKTAELKVTEVKGKMLMGANWEIGSRLFIFKYTNLKFKIISYLLDLLADKEKGSKVSWEDKMSLLKTHLLYSSRSWRVWGTWDVEFLPFLYSIISREEGRTNPCEFQDAILPPPIRCRGLCT